MSSSTNITPRDHLMMGAAFSALAEFLQANPVVDMETLILLCHKAHARQKEMCIAKQEVLDIHARAMASLKREPT